METCTSLADGTVIVIDRNHRTKWKEFGETLLVAVIVSLFPHLESTLDDVMVIPDMYELESFLASILALHQVFEQHGSIPESMGDVFLAAPSVSDFFSYYTDGTSIYPGNSRKTPRERVQFSVSQQAVEHLAWLVSNCDEFERPLGQPIQEIVEDVVQVDQSVIDTSPLVTSSHDYLHVVSEPGEPCGSPCQVCLFVDLGIQIMDVRKLQHPPTCRKTSFRPLTGTSVFKTLVLNHPERILIFGSSFKCHRDPVPPPISRARFLGPVLFHDCPDVYLRQTRKSSTVIRGPRPRRNVVEPPPSYHT